MVRQSMFPSSCSDASSPHLPRPLDVAQTSTLAFLSLHRVDLEVLVQVLAAVWVTAAAAVVDVCRQPADTVPDRMSIVPDPVLRPGHPGLHLLEKAVQDDTAVAPTDPTPPGHDRGRLPLADVAGAARAEIAMEAMVTEVGHEVADDTTDNAGISLVRIGRRLKRV